MPIPLPVSAPVELTPLFPGMARDYAPNTDVVVANVAIEHAMAEAFYAPPADEEELPCYQMNPHLRDFWQPLDDSGRYVHYRYRVLYGGRGSSKSHDAAGHAVWLAANTKVKILCARQFQNRISESVYTLIKDKIDASPFKSDFEVLKTSIRNKRTGSEFLFYGIARNLAEIKSTEGVDILWLEEAHYLNAEQWQTIEPTIRKNGSQIWIIFNPDEYTDFVYQNFVVEPPAGTLKREINWNHNPFLSETMLAVIYDYFRREPEEALHVYGGAPKMGADKSVIPLKYILAAVDAHKPRTRADGSQWAGWNVLGERVIGFDVADDGRDLNATTETHGNVVMLVEEWKGLEDELLKSCSRVYQAAFTHGARIVWDSIGVGAHAGAKFREINEERMEKKEIRRPIVYEPFNAGGRVDDPDGVYMKLPHVSILNKDHFSNIKAQKWDEVADRFRKTYEAIELGIRHAPESLISLNSATIPKALLTKLQMELAAPHKDVDKLGKFKVESKDDLFDRGIKSPNLADSLIMSLIRPKRDSATFF